MKASTQKKNKKTATYLAIPFLSIREWVSQLIEVSEQVTKVFSKRKDALIKTLPDLPVELAETPAAAFLKSLSHSDLPQKIEAACDFSKEDEAARLIKGALETAAKTAEKNLSDLVEALTFSKSIL